MTAVGRDKCRLVIGKNSTLWKTLIVNSKLEQAGFTAVGHRDLADLGSLQDTEVWVFSYSRLTEENRQLFEKLKNKGANEVIYLSTATVNVAEKTSCYSYPRAKHQAELLAQNMLGAKIFRIGVVYTDPSTLPGGKTAATFIPELARFMSVTPWQEIAPLQNFFKRSENPFQSGIEARTYDLYGKLLKISRAWPCLLRPLDVLCRVLGWRWYGYLYMSNSLWYSTTSSSAQD